jgi:hypothetical protein
MMMVAVATATNPMPKTFGRGIPNFPVTADEEREIYSYKVSEGSTMATITHFWSTACGGNVPDWVTKGGISIYRFYIDGETTPSIEYQPRMVSGIGWFPDAPAPAPSPDPPPGPSALENAELYMMGGRGENCEDACSGVGRACSPDVVTHNKPDLIQQLVKADLNTTCVPNSKGWWAPDQPSYVWHEAAGDNFQNCLGYTDVPKVQNCSGAHPWVNRLCHCGAKKQEPEGAHYAKQQMMEVAQQSSSSATPHSHFVGGLQSGVSNTMSQPWGTKWIGKVSTL